MAKRRTRKPGHRAKVVGDRTVPAGVQLGLPGTIRASALILPAKLPWESLERAVGLLGYLGQGVPWWIGDILLAGERAYGERYAQLEVAMQGYTPETLKDLCWVAERIPPARRREKLSWSHHREVAALEPAHQDRLLARAEKEGWTKSRLREAAQKLKKSGSEDAEGVDVSFRARVCECCATTTTCHVDGCRCAKRRQPAA